MLPSKLAQDASSSLVALQAALTNPDLTPFWETRDSERFKGAIGSGISAAFLFAGLAYLLIMFAAASYIARPPQGWMPARMKADVDAGKRKVIPDLTQVTANAAAKRAPFYGLWIMFEAQGDRSSAMNARKFLPLVMNVYAVKMAAVFMGGAIAARAIEPLAVLWCIPGFLRNSWTHAFKLLR